MYLPNPTRPNPRRHQLPPAPRTVVHIDLLWRRGRLGSSAHDLAPTMSTLPARASCTAPYTSLVNFYSIAWGLNGVAQCQKANGL